MPPGGLQWSASAPGRSRAPATTSTGSPAGPTEAVEVVAHLVAIERALAAVAPALLVGIYGHGGTRAINPLAEGKGRCPACVADLMVYTAGLLGRRAEARRPDRSANTPAPSGARQR